MAKKVACVLFALALSCYLAGMFGLVRIFFVLFGLLYFAPFFLVGTCVIWLILPSEVRSKYKGHMVRFGLLVLWCLILLYQGREVINRFYMHDVYYLIRISTKVLLLLLMVFYGWNLLKQGWRKKTIIFTIVYLLFLVGPAVVSPFRGASWQGDAHDSTKVLGTLGYADWVPAGDSLDKVSVTLHKPELSCKGLNLFSLPQPGRFFLMDMQGKILRTWEMQEIYDYDSKWPDGMLATSGDLITYCTDYAFMQVRWDSTERWIRKMRTHHGFFIAPNKDIYALTRKDGVLMHRGLCLPILKDSVTIMSADGEIKRTISLTQAAKHDLPDERVSKIYKYILNPKNLEGIVRRALKGQAIIRSSSAFDVLHTNSVAVVDRDMPGLCEKGDILVSMRDLDMIGILDPDTEEFIWKWGPGKTEGQHHATLLENGHILLFDNGCKRGYSRIIELDPHTNEIVWQYKADPPEDFFSETRGSCQRLPNDNILITESDRGRVFEVTRSGEIVWEFYIPEINESTKARKATYRMVRITNPQDYPLLKKLMGQLSSSP